MTTNNPYSVGSISLVNGQAAFSGTGTAWLSNGIGNGCTLRINSLGLSVTIGAVSSNVAGTLKKPWPGVSGTYAAADYEIWFPTKLQEQAATAAKMASYLQKIFGSGRLVDAGGAPLAPDAYANLQLQSLSASTPPVSPNDGDAYMLANSPTGIWTGYGGMIAIYLDASWVFFEPFEGLISSVAGQPLLQKYTSGSWTSVGGISGIVTPSTASVAVSSPSMGAQIDYASTGGAVTDGTYAAKATHNGTTGETLAGVSLNSVTVTGSTNVLYCFDNDAPAGTTSVNYYVSKNGGPFIKTLSNVAVGLPGVITIAVPTAGTIPPASNTAVSVLASAQAILNGPGFIVIPPSAPAGAPGDPVVGQTILDGRTGAILSRQSWGSPQKNITGSVMTHGFCLDMVVPSAIAVGQQVNGVSASIQQGGTGYGTALPKIPASCAVFGRNYRLGSTDATWIWAGNDNVVFQNQNAPAYGREIDVGNNSGADSIDFGRSVGLNILGLGNNRNGTGIIIGGGTPGGFLYGVLIDGASIGTTGILIGTGIPEGLRTVSPLVLDSLGSASGSANYASTNLKFRGSVWSGSAALVEEFGMQVQPGAGAEPYTTLRFMHVSGTNGSVFYQFEQGNILAITTAAASGTANQAAPQIAMQGNYWTGSASQSESWTFLHQLGSGANPFSTFAIRHNGTPGTTSVSIADLLLLQTLNTADSTHNYASPDVSLRSSIWNGSAAATDEFHIGTFFGAGANPYCGLHFSHPSGSTGSIYYQFENGALLGLKTAAATSGANQSGAALILQGAVWHAGASAADLFTVTHTLAAGTDGASTLAFTHNGSAGTCRYQFDNPTISPSHVLTASAVTAAAGQLALGATTATTAAAGSNGAVPAQVAGYLIANLSGSTVKIPYYNP